MPLYEFACLCGSRVEEFRKLCDWTPGNCIACGREMEYVISAPTLHVWNAERKFPNVGRVGDGSMAFNSKAAYQKHLTDTDVVEVSTDAPIKVPHGTTRTIFRETSR